MKFIAWTVLVAGTLAAAGCASDDAGAPKPADPKKKEPAKAAPITPPANPWKGTGFTVWEGLDGKQWVFLEKSQDKEMMDFLGGKMPAKPVSRDKLAPGGKTLHAASTAALDTFATWKPGFMLRLVMEKDKPQVWVFKEGAKELAEFDAKGAPAKSVTRVGAGPGGATLRAVDAETLDAWTKKKYP